MSATLAAYLPLYTTQDRNYDQLFQFTQREDLDSCGAGVPVDIRTWTAKMQIRESLSGPVILELTDALALDQIEIENDDQGFFIIKMSPASLLAMDKTKYVYDLLFVDDTGVKIDAFYGDIHHRIASTR